MPISIQEMIEDDGDEFLEDKIRARVRIRIAKQEWKPIRTINKKRRKKK